jgi:phytoene dehydrogenase-like protein
MAGGTQRVNVVGGGIAGLIAAALLARDGFEVRMFEAAAELGGRARTRAADGFALNQGPHALYPGAFRRGLDRLGVAHPGAAPRPHEPQGVWQGRLHRLPTSAVSLAMSGLLSMGDKLAYGRVMKAITDGATGEGSFADWLDAQELSPVLRASIEAIARVSSYANAPDMVPAAAMLDQMRLGLSGVVYVDGGWATLVDGLAQAARAAGVEINTGAAVERVWVEGRVSRLALADGSQAMADATLLAVGPKQAAVFAPGVGSLAEEAREAIPVRANVLDLALRKLPEGAREFVLGVDRPWYFSLHSRAAKLAPEGGAVVHVAKYLPVDEQPGADAIAELEALADLAMPGWRAFEVRRQELRGMTVANAVVRVGRKRPGVSIEDAPGLFIAGDWVGDEGMIADAAAASAMAAAEAVGVWLRSGAVASAA